MTEVWRSHRTAPVDQHDAPPLVAVSCISLSPAKFRISWLLISLCHLSNAVFALTAAGWHLIMATPVVHDNTPLIGIPRSLLLLGGSSYFVTGMLHTVVWLQDIRQSIRCGRLAFRSQAAADSSRITPEPNPSPGQTSRPTNSVVTALRVLAAPVRLWTKYFASNGLFGLQGDLFESSFHCRQLIEIALQTYQAYQLSQSVPHLWISHSVVAMILVTGVSPPILQWSMATKNKLLHRLVSLAIDLLTDFGISVVVPMCVFVPYILELDLKFALFPPERVYNDIWVTTARSDARFVLVSSYLDYISSLLPPVICHFGLASIKTILRPTSTTTTGTSTSSVSPGPQAFSTVQTVRTASRSNRGSSAALQTSPSRKGTRWVLSTSEGDAHVTVTGRRVSYLCAVWSLAVLVIHSMAICKRYGGDSVTIDHCILRVHSWILSSREPCAIAQINCHRLPSMGSPQEVHDALDRLDRGTLTRVIFTHCPALHIPMVLHEFSGLHAFVTFNLTIAEWPEHTALTSHSTPMMVWVDLVDTNFSSMAPLRNAIFHTELPTGLSLRLIHSNFTELPDDIGDVWHAHKWSALWIENTQLQSLPASFRDLTIYRLSLSGNQLTTLDDDLFITNRPTRLRLSRNPLISLPTSLEAYTMGGELTNLMVEDTQLTGLSSSLQSWLISARLAADIVVSFHGSPLCANDNGNGTLVLMPICEPLGEEYKDEYRYDIVVAQRPV